MAQMRYERSIYTRVTRAAIVTKERENYRDHRV